MVQNYEKRLTMMQRRATVAELIMGFFILLVVTCACGAYFAQWFREGQARRMEEHVKGEVAGYF